MTETASTRFPNGVVNTDGSVGYTMHGDRLFAIRLQDGKILWTSKHAMHCVAADAKRVVGVQGVDDSNQIRLISLDPVSGLPLGSSVKIDLPTNVHPKRGLRNSFQVSANLDESVLKLKWLSEGKPAKGIISQEEAALGQAAPFSQGTVSYVLDSGKVSQQIDPTSRPEENDDIEPIVDSVEARMDDRFVKTWKTTAGKAYLRTATDDESQQSFLELTSESSVHGKTTTRIINGQYFEPWVVAEGQMILVARLNQEEEKREWHIFSVEEMKVLANFHSNNLQYPAVTNQTLYYFEKEDNDLNLVARTLPSAGIKWSLTLPIQSANRTKSPPTLRK